MGGNKSGKQLSEKENIMHFYKSWEVIKINDYFNMVLLTAHQSKHGKDLKLFTPRQMLQRLPVALTHFFFFHNNDDHIYKLTIRH